MSAKRRAQKKLLFQKLDYAWKMGHPYRGSKFIRFTSVGVIMLTSYNRNYILPSGSLFGEFVVYSQMICLEERMIFTLLTY